MNPAGLCQLDVVIIGGCNVAFDSTAKLRDVAQSLSLVKCHYYFLTECVTVSHLLLISNLIIFCCICIMPLTVNFFTNHLELYSQ